MTGFLGGMVTTFVLAPLLALAWRQRKYMADAIAVRLTRDPDGLARALAQMGGGVTFAPWAAHLAVAESHARGTWLGNSIMPMIPSASRRMRALQRLGAHVAPLPSGFPKPLLAIMIPLAAVAGMLMPVAIVLTAWLCVALSMILTGLPVSMLHYLLRWLGK
jgi:hypothetical protein